MLKFANLTGDAVFKTVFCDRSDTSNLVLLLNTFLHAEAKIDSILEFIDREMDSETIDGKTSFLDLHCKNDKNEEFIVEMQSYKEVNTYYRFVYYCAKAFCDNAKKGDPNYKDCTKDEERCIWMLRNIHKLKEYPVWVEESKYKGFVKSKVCL